MKREQDGFAPTVTFYPECLVKPHWKETSEVEPDVPCAFPDDARSWGAG
jgi:hypothetical protein